MQPIYVFPTGINAIQENGAQQWLEINKRFHCFDSDHFLEAQMLLRHISWHVGVIILGVWKNIDTAINTDIAISQFLISIFFFFLMKVIIHVLGVL